MLCILLTLHIVIPLASSSCTPVAGCECYWYNPSLYYLCTSTGLTELPAFSPLLTYLEFSQQIFESITDSDFLDYPALEYIELQYNRITSISANAFQQNPLITDIRLGFNQIYSLPGGIFKYNTELSILHLNRNRIATLPSGIFNTNVKLAQLYLHDNLLITLSHDVFQFNTRLGSLTMDRNHFDYLNVSFPSGVYAKCDECFDCECLNKDILDWVENRIPPGATFFSSCMGTKFDFENQDATPTDIKRQQFELCSDDGYMRTTSFSDCSCNFPTPKINETANQTFQSTSTNQPTVLSTYLSLLGSTESTKTLSEQTTTGQLMTTLLGQTTVEHRMPTPLDHITTYPSMSTLLGQTKTEQLMSTDRTTTEQRMSILFDRTTTEQNFPINSEQTTTDWRLIVLLALGVPLGVLALCSSTAMAILAAKRQYEMKNRKVEDSTTSSRKPEDAIIRAMKTLQRVPAEQEHHAFNVPPKVHALV